MKKMFMAMMAIVALVFLSACTNSAPSLKDIELDLLDLKARLEIPNVDLTNVATNINLPTLEKGKHGDIKITWESSNTDYLSHDGVVTRPNPTERDSVNVKLTATLDHLKSQVEELHQKDFNLTIVARELSPEERVADAAGKLSVGYYAARPFNPDYVYDDIRLPGTGLNNTTITWTLGEIPKAPTVEGDTTEYDLITRADDKLIIRRAVFGAGDPNCVTTLELPDQTKEVNCHKFSFSAVVSYENANSEPILFEIKIPESDENINESVKLLAALVKGWILIPAVSYEEGAPRDANSYECVSDPKQGAICYVGEYLDLPQDYLGVGANFEWSSTRPDLVNINQENTRVTFNRANLEKNESFMLNLLISAVGAEAATVRIPMTLVKPQKDGLEQIEEAKNSFDNFPTSVNTGYISEIVPTSGNVDIFWEIKGEHAGRLSSDGTVYRPISGNLDVTITARFTASVCELFEQKDPSNNNEYVLNPDNLTRPRVDTSCKSDWDELIDSGWGANGFEKLVPTNNNVNDNATNNSYVKVEKNSFGNAIRYYVEFDGNRYDFDMERAYNSLSKQEEAVYYYYHVSTRDFNVTLQDASQNTNTTLRTIGGKIYSLNPHQYEYSTEGEVLGSVLAAFYTTVPTSDFKNYEWIPELAESDPEQMDAQGLVWRVTIKEGLKFYSGEAITTKDYIDSYKLLLEPKLKNYRAYALYDSIKVEGARNYFRGTETDFNNVGIKAIDDYTLEFSLLETETMESFRTALATFILSPVNTTKYASGIQTLSSPGAKGETQVTNYGTSLENFDGHGSYKLILWNRAQVRRFAINSDYPNFSTEFLSANPHLEPSWTHLKHSVIEDSNIALQEFLQGKHDIVSIAGDNAKNYDCSGTDLQENKCSTPKSAVGTAVWKLSVNSINVQDENLRKALFFGIDRDSLVSSDKGAAYPHVATPTMLTTAYYPQAIYEDSIGGNLVDGIKGLKSSNPGEVTSENFADQVVEGLGQPFRNTAYGKEVLNELGISGSGFDPNLARESFSKACVDSYGGSGTITLSLLTFTSSDSMRATVEWVEEFYETLFNQNKNFATGETFSTNSSNCKIDIKLVYQPANVAYQTMMTYGYDLAMNAWSGGAFDPWGMFEVYKGDAGTCYASPDGKCENFRQKLEPFNNADLNTLLNQVLSSSKNIDQWASTGGGLKNPSNHEDYRLKMEALKKLEVMLLEGYEFIPMYTTSSHTLFNTRINLKNSTYIAGVGYAVPYADVATYDTGKVIPQ